MMQAKSDRYWLTIIVLVSVLLRVAVAVYLGNEVVELPGTFDQVSYDMLAKQVLNGKGFTVAEQWWPVTPAGEPTAHWSYLYVLYLVAIYSVFGYIPLVARLIQAIIVGILMPLLVYQLGKRHFGRPTGLIAAGLMAGYIYFFYYSATLMTETFYITAILGTMYLADKLQQALTDETDPRQSARKIKLSVGLGLTLATAVLLRQLFLLFIPFLFLWLLWCSYRDRNRKKVFGMITNLGIATTILVLAIIPFTIRNYQVFDRFVLLNTNAGFAFFWGNHPIHGTTFVPILPADGPSYQDLIPEELLGLNEAELDSALLTRAINTIVADPVRYLRLSLSRVEEYFKFWPSSESGLISNISRVFSFGILWPFMLYGIIMSVRQKKWAPELLIFYLFIVVYTGVHLLTWTLIRYRLPIDAILLIFAGAAFVDIKTKFYQWRAKSRKSINF